MRLYSGAIRIWITSERSSTMSHHAGPMLTREDAGHKVLHKDHRKIANLGETYETEWTRSEPAVTARFHHDGSCHGDVCGDWREVPRPG